MNAFNGLLKQHPPEAFMRRRAVVKSLSTLASIPVAILAAAALTWLLSPSARSWQAGAGLFLLTAVIGVIAFDVFHGRFHLSNIKYFILCSYAVFLGIGMLLVLRNKAYTFDGQGIVLA